MRTVEVRREKAIVSIEFKQYNCYIRFCNIPYINEERKPEIMNIMRHEFTTLDEDTRVTHDTNMKKIW